MVALLTEPKVRPLGAAELTLSFEEAIDVSSALNIYLSDPDRGSHETRHNVLAVWNRIKEELGLV